MEGYIKILEAFINDRLYKYARNSFTKGDLADLDMLIGSLIKGYRELKEITNQYDAFESDDMPNDVKMIIADREYFNNGIFKENFIPKSKIKEKIEEYKQEMKEIRAKEKGLIWNHRLHKLDYAIEVLQELLGDE